jgi:hypothetical protein
MEQTTFVKRLRQLLVVMVAVVLLYCIWLAYYATTFHVISTNPHINNVDTTSPTLEINFSKAVASAGYTVSSNPSIVSRSTATAKQLTLHLVTPLSTSQSYTITIKSITDNKGKQLKTISYTFTPKSVGYASLPASQQAATLKQQQAAASNQPPSFLGMDTLITDGVSTEQVQAMETAIENFAQTTNLHLTSTVIDDSSVQAGAPNENNEALFTVDFSVSINGTSYQAVLDYTGITSAELILSNPSTGAQVFDSGMLSAGS